MPTPSSTPSSKRRWPRSRGAALALALVAPAACSDPEPVQAQQVVFDPKNHVENALQAARQLESLANEARMLANQARELAASPYSHLSQTSQALRNIGELARSAKGLAADVEGLQEDFAELYPTAVQGLDPKAALQLQKARNEKALATARDLAGTAAQLERLAEDRPGRIEGALAASQSATGQTAAIQSSTQVLAVLAEDLGSLRTILAAQSRLMAQEAARRSAERAAGEAARRRLWAREPSMPAAPDFEPFPHALR